MDRVLNAIAVTLLALACIVLAVRLGVLNDTFEHSVAETSWRIDSLEAQVERLLEEADAR